MPRFSKRIALVLLLLAFVAGQAPSVGALTDRLPDLGMARVANVRVDKTQDGRLLLRFTATIVNVGAGPFEARAGRSSPSDPMSAPVQRIYDDGGGFRDVPTTAALIFGGDGHGHWHIRDLESAEMVRLDNGAKFGTLAKHGFCFWDNVAYRTALPGAPTSPFYSSAGCGTTTSTSLTMGLSVGWGDRYAYTLPDQYVDITGLGAGRYRLVVTANALGQFVEASSANNQTWVDLQLRAKGQPKIVGYGPAA